MSDDTPTSPSSSLTPEQALRKAALEIAADYHARLASSPHTTGNAKPATVTATAADFAKFMQRAADKAGVEPEDLETRRPPRTR